MEGLSVETLELLQKTAVKAEGARQKLAIISDLPHEPPGVYGVVNADGSFERAEALQPPRKHTLITVDQVPVMVKHFAGNPDCTPAVWYDKTGIVVIANDDTLNADLRPRATLTLKTTEHWQTLSDLAKQSVWMLHRDFVTFLRIKLGECIERTNGNLLSVLRKMKFSSAVNQRGDITRGRESLGSDIDDEVFSEAGDLPEHVLFELQVFDDPGLLTKSTVRCALEVDAREGKLMLMPLAGELSRAMDLQMTRLAEILQDSLEDVPMFHGKP